ncbi:TetR/AcrR family transcriptional regulator [Edaphocola aurantiacus]|uniref:TetR/AcrR family transcriptional regulator n=1 Tax=Edaphocola aurantiacus TaxID=2601682 RepID=UPI001C98C97B|nr:TetR/AcrR family transcriptional regulator [Edaphocola aurantiacus]
MKGRPNIHQDEEIILKAQEVFWQKGYTATSLSDLSSATGAGAGSLYNTFKGGKKELFKRALQQRKADLEQFKQTLINSEEPVKLIKNFFLDIAHTDNMAHHKGCIVANTIIEMSFVDEELEQEAILILKETEALYKSVIAKEQKKGNMQSVLPAGTLAKYLITLWCGINSLRRMYPDQKVLKTQIALQLEILS